MKTSPVIAVLPFGVVAARPSSQLHLRHLIAETAGCKSISNAIDKIVINKIVITCAAIATR